MLEENNDCSTTNLHSYLSRKSLSDLKKFLKSVKSVASNRQLSSLLNTLHNILIKSMRTRVKSFKNFMVGQSRNDMSLVEVVKGVEGDVGSPTRSEKSINESVVEIIQYIHDTYRNLPPQTFHSSSINEIFSLVSALILDIEINGEEKIRGLKELTDLLSVCRRSARILGYTARSSVRTKKKTRSLSSSPCLAHRAVITQLLTLEFTQQQQTGTRLAKQFPSPTKPLHKNAVNPHGHHERRGVSVNSHYVERGGAN